MAHVSGPLTLRGFLGSESLLSFSSFDVSNSVAYSCDGFSFVVGNGDTEFFFELHDKFYSVKAVSTEIGSERSGFGYFVFVYTKFINDNSFYAICNF